MIRNSYERLSANKQQLEEQQRAASSLANQSAGGGANADLTDVARSEIAMLDQQIMYEQEMDRQLPFPV